MAESPCPQRQAETDAAERLVKTGNLPKLQLDKARSEPAAANSLLETAKPSSPQ